MEQNNEKKAVIISLRIPAWLKHEMDKVDINWSEYIRQSIEERIKLEKAKRVWREIETIVRKNYDSSVRDIMNSQTESNK